MFSNTGQNHFIFLPNSRLFTAYSTFPCVKKEERNQLYLHLPTYRLYEIGLGKIQEPINQITFTSVEMP